MRGVPPCVTCKHYSGTGPSCEAYDRIPIAIYAAVVDHRKPYPGDNGIQYEPIKDGDNANV